MADAKLLTPPHNYAIVHLPERAFPGIVVQGDSFHTIVRDIEAALSKPEVREEILSYLLKDLREIQASYEAVLTKHGIKLPYFRDNG